MVHISAVTTLAMVIFSVLIAFISAQAYDGFGYGSDSQFGPEQYLEALSARQPHVYNRALRSNGKPTFIRFGKRSFVYANKPAYL